jgi:hypothetical protein
VTSVGRVLVVALMILFLAHSAAGVAEAGRHALRFGIYPNAAVGTVGQTAAARPEHEAARWNALERLRGTHARALVLHLYTSWDGRTGYAEVMSGVNSDIAMARVRGFPAEVVLRYRPDPSLATDVAVPAYADFVRAAVRQLSAARNVVGVQITNEANVAGQPDASDGDYPGVRQALVAGVRAAKQEARRAARRELEIGFNVAAGAPPAFWRSLRALGGASFGRAVDWVGVDLYPQTWTSTDRRGPHAAAATMRTELRYLRHVALPAAGIPRRARLHVTENGFPTGPTRNESQQAELLVAAIKAVAAVSRRYGVSDYRWFGLRDANSSDQSFESQYGVLRDDYTPKQGFDALRALIARLGASR